MKHQIIVGNIGTVYDGEDSHQAAKDYGTFKRQSLSGEGRAAFEQVSWLKDGELFAQLPGSFYDYEYTDTFGGEANYCWVKRGTIYTTASNPVTAVKKALGLNGVPCKRLDMGGMIELRPYGYCTVCFITWHEGA